MEDYTVVPIPPNSSLYKMGMITIDNTHPLASFIFMNYHPYIIFIKELRGHHVYKTAWTPVIGQMVDVQAESRSLRLTRGYEHA